MTRRLTVLLAGGGRSPGTLRHGRGPARLALPHADHVRRNFAPDRADRLRPSAGVLGSCPAGLALRGGIHERRAPDQPRRPPRRPRLPPRVAVAQGAVLRRHRGRHRLRVDPRSDRGGLRRRAPLALLQEAFAAGPAAPEPPHGPVRHDRPAPRPDAAAGGRIAPGATADARFRQHPAVAFHAVDEDVFLVDRRNQSIYHLNLVGAGLWRLLRAPSTAAQAIAVLQAAFPDADPQRASARPCHPYREMVAGRRATRVPELC